MYEEIKNEIRKLVSEGWTDGMAVVWGTVNDTQSVFLGNVSGSEAAVTENTVYDLASATKLVFLTCVLKLVDDKKLALEACVGDYSSLFPHISDLKIYELMNFSKLLQTDRRIDSCKERNEAMEVLHNTRVMAGISKYTDMGAIILSKIINEIPGASFSTLLSEISNACGLDSTYIWEDLPSELLSRMQSYDNEYLLKEGELIVRHTPIGTPHDTKARILGSCGHAGVFSTPKDISRLSQGILSGKIISKETLSLVTSPRYDHYYEEQHYGLLCYKKSKVEWKSEIPARSSDAAFAISGFTGTYLLIDPENDYFISINSNRIFNRCTNSSTDIDGIKASRDYVYRKDAVLNIIPVLFSSQI